MTIDKTTVRTLVDHIFDKSDKIVCDTSVYIPFHCHYDENNINLSSIATTLIQETGRWCESYASDFIITWDAVRDAVTKHLQTPEILSADVFTFGIRRNGVDHNEYIASRLYNGIDFNTETYRKVYAVQILDHDNEDGDGKYVYVTLKEVTSEVGSAHYCIQTNRLFEKKE